MKEPIRISVIIPTFNAGSSLEELLFSMEDQELKVEQVIVVDSGSADQTVAVAKDMGAVVLKVKKESFDHGATRNYAAATARGNYLLFMTQDALPVNARLTAELARPFADVKVAVSYARQIAGSEALLSEQYLRRANYPLKSRVKDTAAIAELGIKAFQSSNACSCYRKDLFLKLGGFPEPVVCNEDMLFNAQAIFNGYKVVYCADAAIWHAHCYGAGQLFRRYFDIAASLDHDPRIREVGKAEKMGYQFFNGYLEFLKKKRKLYYLPAALIETIARYLGYKAGEKHHYLPKVLKRFLGRNQVYWSRIN